MKVLRHAAAAWVLALAAGSVATATAAAAAPAATTFADWSENFAADWVRLSAERATTTQYFGADEQAVLDRELTPLTPAQRQRRLALARAGLMQLDGFAASALKPDERVGAAAMAGAVATEPAARASTQAAAA